MRARGRSKATDKCEVKAIYEKRESCGQWGMRAMKKGGEAVTQAPTQLCMR